MPPTFGGAPKCPRCEKSVYMAEQVNGPGGFWHKSCLTCKECNKRLDSTTLTEKENEAYCRTCYNRRWGPKGYGFAGGAAFLGTETKMPSEVLEEKYNDGTLTRSSSFNSASRVTTPPLPARENSNASTPVSEQQQPEQRAAPVLPARNNANTTSATPAPVPAPAPTLPQRPSQTSSPSQPTQTDNTTSSTSFGGYLKHHNTYSPRKFNFNQYQDVCARCKKAVYAAELVLGGGNKYHKYCLKCKDCGKQLDSTNMVDRESDLYCRGCYSKAFGPKGYGYNNLLTPEGATR